MADYYTVGTIVKPQGLKGEVRVLATTDFPEERFKPGSVLAIFDGDTKLADVTVTTHRQQKAFDIVHFDGYDTIEAIEPFVKKSLQVAAAERTETLAADEFYYDDIIGLTVVDLDGQARGTITAILSPGANDVWVMKRNDTHAEVLLPYIEDVVKNVDLARGVVTVDFIEGLMDDEN